MKNTCLLVALFFLLFSGCSNRPDADDTCQDLDGDGYGTGVGCLGTDCNDEDSQVNPGTAEVPYDGVDNDCDTSTLDDDLDGDGFDHDLDCNDNDQDINPDAEEICEDGIDQDCDGSDADCECIDADQDGHPDIGCGGDDCDDSNPQVNPDQQELCGNGIDDDCDTGTPDLWDGDEDDYNCLDDCDDADPLVSPGVQEQCGNGVDDDCNADTPDLWDADEDGFDCYQDCDDTLASCNLDCSSCVEPVLQSAHAADGGGNLDAEPSDTVTLTFDRDVAIKTGFDSPSQAEIDACLQLSNGLSWGSGTSVQVDQSTVTVTLGGADYTIEDGAELTIAGDCITHATESVLPATGSSPISGSFSPPAVSGSVIISEVMWNPSAVSDDAGEYVELYNTSDSPISLARWSLTDASDTSPLVFSDVEIPAGGYIVVAKSSVPVDNGGIDNVVAEIGFSLNQGGDTLTLSDHTDAVIDTVTYGSGWPGGDGVAMELSQDKLDADQNDDISSWCDAETTYGMGDFGTPGVENGDCPTTPPPTLVSAVAVDAGGSIGSEPTDVVVLTFDKNVALKSGFDAPSQADIDACLPLEGGLSWGTQAAVQAADSVVTITLGGTDITIETGVNLAVAGDCIFDAVENSLLATGSAGITGSFDPGTGDPTILSVEPAVIAHGSDVVITGDSMSGSTVTVTLGGIEQTITENTAVHIRFGPVADSQPVSSAVGDQELIVHVDGVDSNSQAVSVVHLVINELDSDTPSSDQQEFVEISAGLGGADLYGYVMVLYNGSSDTSYLAIDLGQGDGSVVSDSNGRILLGNAAVVPAPDIVFPDGTLQNGADAAAIHQGLSTGFPNGTPASDAAIIDALVYGTSDPVDSLLLETLLGTGPQSIQLDEGLNSNSSTESVSRCFPERLDGRSFVVGTPTPADDNACP